MRRIAGSAEKMAGLAPGEGDTSEAVSAAHGVQHDPPPAQPSIPPRPRADEAARERTEA
jgi:hypothetical protein